MPSWMKKIASLRSQLLYSKFSLLHNPTSNEYYLHLHCERSEANPFTLHYINSPSLRA